jgi:peroxiredoxin
LPSTIEQIHRELKDRGLTVLAVNLAEPRDVLAAWVKQRNVTLTVLLDPAGDVARSYAIAHTPTVFLVDRQGRLVGKAIGTRQWTGDKGRALLRLVMER